jgi:hypothetical protein
MRSHLRVLGRSASPLRSAARSALPVLVALAALAAGCGARSAPSLGGPSELDAGPRRDAPGVDVAVGRDASLLDTPSMETDAPGFDAPRSDVPLFDAPRSDVPLFDAPRSDVPLFDASLFDAPRSDVPLFDASLFDAPRSDAPSPGRDAPLPDAPRVDAPSAELIGCADGAREGFRDATRFARIAACGGGFALPGVLVEEAPACGRSGGDDGPRPAGEGCRAADLCAAGWHVCRSAAEVAAASPGGCAGLGDVRSAFFATAQSGPGCRLCAVGTRSCGFAECSDDCAPDRRAGSVMANDVFGCGTLGDVPSPNCGPLDRFSGDECAFLEGPWLCSRTSGFDEALVVTKPGPDRGGVLCCRDDVTE